MPASHGLTPSPCTSAVRRGAPPRVVDIDALPASALLTTAQVSALTGFAVITLKVWRRAGGTKGPKVSWIEGRPRYRASDVRAWLVMSSPRVATA